MENVTPVIKVPTSGKELQQIHRLITKELAVNSATNEFQELAKFEQKDQKFAVDRVIIKFNNTDASRKNDKFRIKMSVDPTHAIIEDMPVEMIGCPIGTYQTPYFSINLGGIVINNTITLDFYIKTALAVTNGDYWIAIIGRIL